jgi:hypothetical protein
MVGQDAYQWALGWLPRLGTNSRIVGPPRGMVGLREACLASSGNLRMEDEKPAVTLTRELVPRSLHKSVFLGFSKKRSYTTEASFMLSGTGLTCCGESSFAFLSEDDRIIDELSFDIWTNKSHHLRRQLWLPRAERIPGIVCAVLEPQWQTYGHWLLDFAPRLAWAKRWLDRNGIKARFLLTYGGKAHERALLGALGICEEDVIPWKSGVRLEADRWFIPSYTSYSASNLTREGVELVREAFLKQKIQTSQKGKRYYLSRQNDSFRRVLNESEVITCLSKRGFEAINPARFPIAQQAELFSNAEAVVSVISSGLSNIVFMRPGSAVIEIFPENFFMTVEWALCDLLDLRFFYLFENGSLPEGQGALTHRFADVHVNISALERTLDLADIK